VAARYAPGGERAFDYGFIGGEVYRLPLQFVVSPDPGEVPDEAELAEPLGGHLDGCRIGFDLGGSDRKCAALIDGRVVFSEEVKWDPYFQSDPSYHIEGVDDCLRRAAAHLPRVDAIGGSAAGVYVGNEVRAGSLFRGVSREDFDRRVRGMFSALQERWGGVPFVVVNDGEVTALAGAMESGSTGVLGVAMGTSEAAGYVNPAGQITNWLNELAFAPVDFRPGAPADEWSGDAGCGVQYLSQQAVARLAPAAGIAPPPGAKAPDVLAEVGRLAGSGDARGLDVFATVGAYLGHAVAHYATYYDISEVLVLGRVTSGVAGDVILREATAVLEHGFPALAARVRLRSPGESAKRHGQAIAAASLAPLFH
jgi:predicted NBD/HSP70 family sugar kinase